MNHMVMPISFDNHDLVFRRRMGVLTLLLIMVSWFRASLLSICQMMSLGADRAVPGRSQGLAVSGKSIRHCHSAIGI